MAAASPSFMAAEIAAQPQVLGGLLEAETANVRRIAAAVRSFNPCFAMMVARGSSDNAALYGKYLFGFANRMPVALAAPSLFTLYQSPPDLARALVVAISQSGQSPDLLEVASNARSQGALTVAITNDPSSPLAELCRWVIPLHAGPERSVAATKSYTAQLMALAMLSAAMAERADLQEALSRVPEQVGLALQSQEAARLLGERLRGTVRCIVIGRGFNYSTAQEIALKIKELAAVAADSYSAADFMHGPLAMVEPGFPVLVVAPDGATFAEMSRLATRLRRLGVEVLAISDLPTIPGYGPPTVSLGCRLEEWLTPIAAVVPGQWLALHLAVAKGFNPDKPRRLAKVTRTR